MVEVFIGLGNAKMFPSSPNHFFPCEQMNNTNTMKSKKVTSHSQSQIVPKVQNTQAILIQSATLTEK